MLPDSLRTGAARGVPGHHRADGIGRGRQQARGDRDRLAGDLLGGRLHQLCGQTRVVIGDVGDLAETSELVAKAGNPAMAARLDISDPAVVDGVRERVADEPGRVDILVNNAAIFESATWDDLDFDRWQLTMAVNLNGPMLMCKAFLPLMRGRGWGRIINMASATVAIGTTGIPLIPSRRLRCLLRE